MSEQLYEYIFHSVEEVNISLIGVIFCCLCLLPYILKLTIFNDDISAVVHVKRPVIPKVNYDAVSIPFSFTLEKSQDGNNKGLKFNLKYMSSCSVHFHWHACATSLKSILYLTWSQFIKQIKSSHSLKSVCDQEIGKFPNPNDEQKVVTVPVSIPELPYLGKPPRTKFPLMICIQKTDTTEGIGNKVGALVLILHISDEDCPMPNVVLYQYLKHYSGQLTQLKSLYTQSSDVHKDNSSNSNGETVPIEEACVICKDLKPVRALLPCRHVCVCTLCFPSLENCPMCRSYIEAFFVTDEPEAKLQEEMDKERSDIKEEVRHRSFFENLNPIAQTITGIQPNQ